MGSELDFLLDGVVDPAEHVKESNAFLEKMKHKSAYELVKSIKEFTTYFVEGGYTPDEQSKLVHQFIKSLMDRIIMHPLWISEGKEAIELGTEALERYLLHKLYGVTFHHPSTNDMTTDERFYYQLRRLQFIQPSHLDIPDRPLNNAAFELAAQANSMKCFNSNTTESPYPCNMASLYYSLPELHFLDHMQCKSPREKLTCMLNAIKILTNLLRHYGDEESTGADDLFPYLIYTILKASPRQLHSNIRFIYRYRSRTKLNDEPAYYLMQVETAVAFIENISCKELSISEEDFECGVRECEERIRNGKDTLTRFAIRERKFSERETSLLTGTITPADSMVESSSNLLHTEASHLSSDIHPVFSSTPSNTAPLLINESEQILDHSQHTKSSSETHSTPRFSSGNNTPNGEFIVEKFLNCQFEQLTIAELRNLLQCYKNLAQGYLELKHRTMKSK